MSVKVLTCANLLFLAIIDVTVSVLLFCRLDLDNIWRGMAKLSLLQYDFCLDLIDLLFLSFLRLCIALGVIIGVCWRSDVAISRLSNSGSWVFSIAVVGVLYTLAKLLATTEQLKPEQQDWVFWCQLCSSLFATCFLAVDIYFFVPSSCCSTNQPTSEDTDPLVVRDVSESSRDSETIPVVTTRRKMGNIVRLIKFSLPDWPVLVPAFFFLVVAATAEVFIPKFTGMAIAAIVSNKSMSDVARPIAFMGIGTLISAFATGLRGCCFTVANGRVARRIRNKLFSALLNREVAFFDENRTGDLMSRLSNDVSTMTDTLNLNLNMFLRNVIQSVGIAIMMFGISWRISLLTLASMPVIAILQEAFGNYYETLSTKVQESLSKASQVAEEVLSNFRTILSLNGRPDELKRYYRRLNLFYELRKKQAVVYCGLIWANNILSVALTVATLAYSAHLTGTGQMSGDILVTIMLYQLSLSECLQQIGNVYTGLMEATGASVKVFDLLDKAPGNKLAQVTSAGPGPSIFSGNFGAKLEFRNVSFCYPTRKDIQALDGISFVLEPGKVVALVGHSGSGKSSVIALTERWYTPVSGSILFDGRLINDYADEVLHGPGGIALVGQEPVLFGRSILSNICYPELDDDDGDRGSSSNQNASTMKISADSIARAEDMTRLADAHEFISALSDKYNTQCGEKGTQLSAGQKQRIAIARALYRRPRLLILDEATSALDATAELAVQNQLSTALSGLTILVVAHRLSTVRNADRILVMDHGRIVESGTHTELLTDRPTGHYATLVRNQIEQQQKQGNVQEPSETIDIIDTKDLSVRSRVNEGRAIAIASPIILSSLSRLDLASTP